MANVATSNMMERVWHKLNGSVASVKIARDALIDDLRQAIKEKRANVLASVDAADLTVFAAGADPDEDEHLDPGDTVPSNTTSKEPLIVVAPEPRQQQQQQQQQPPGNVSGSDVHVLADQLARMLKGESGPTKTASTRGREELEALRFTRSITQAPLNETLPPILTTDALAKLHEDFEAALESTPKISPSEAAVTALLTPSIAGLVREVADETQSGLVLSNTEYIQWLPPTANAPKKEWKKPDLLTAHPAMLVTREQNGGAGIVNFRNSRADWGVANCNFGGVEPKKNSIDFVSSLWEGKCDLGNMHEALGEMADYVKCFVIANSLISFILYDKFGFVGGYAKRGQITELVVNAADDQNGSVIPWDANGSKHVLKNLLKNRIPERMVLMEKAKRVFNASWKPYDGKSPYLGSGGFGDVYRVEVEGNIQALKVARKGQTKAEFDTLKEAYEDGAPVVKVLREKHEDGFAAYTMEPVGTPFANRSQANVPLLFSSLFALHLCGWYHGDARWQNVIVFEKEVLWCDFRWARKSQPLELYYRACDVQTLVESLLRSKGVTIPSISDIEGMVKSDLASYDEIAKFVSNTMLSGRPPKD